MDFVKVGICLPHGVTTWFVEVSDADRLVLEYCSYLKGAGAYFGEYRYAASSHVSMLSETRFLQLSFAHVVYLSRLTEW